MEKDIVQTIVESPTHFVLQNRDDLPNVLHGGKNALWGGQLEPEDATPLDGALRELIEETSLRPHKDDLTFVCITKYEGVTHSGEKIKHSFHIYHLSIEGNDFEVFEGAGRYLLPKDEDPADHKLTPSTQLIMSLYLKTLTHKKEN